MRMTGKCMKSCYVSALVLFLLMAFVVAVFVSSQIMGGRTWDEELDYLSVSSQLDVVARFLHGDMSAHFSQVYGNLSFYGIVAVFPAYVARQLAEHWAMESPSSVYSHTLHATAFLCYLLTLPVTFGIIRRATSNCTAALCGTVLLALYPLWLGFSFFDHKDVPLAFFNALALYAAIGLLQSGDDAKVSRFFTALLVIATILLAGLRLAALVLIVPSWLSAFYVHLSRKNFITALFVVASTFVGVMLVTPVAWSDPVNFIMQSLMGMVKHSWAGCTLSAGTWMCPQQESWSAADYILTWYTAQIPVLIGVGALVAIGMSIRLGPVNMLISATLVLPLLLIALRNSVLYDGLRHLLFTLPLIFILATIFWTEIARRAGSVPVLIVSGVMACLFIWDNIAMFPYNYVYFNFPTRALANDGNFVTDLWGFSLKEAAHKPIVDEKPGLAVIAAPQHLVVPFLQQSHPQIVTPNQVSSLPHQSEAVMIAYVRDYPVPSWCKDPQFVTRHLPMGQEIRMSYAARCVVP